MEQTPRTSTRPDGLRPLALPHPIHVQLDDSTGLPTRLRTLPRQGLPLRASSPTNRRTPSRPTSRRPTNDSGRLPPSHPSGSPGRVFDVLDIAEIWRIAEEWWRPHPIQRTYYNLVLEDGRPLTIFHDETPETAPSPEGDATSDDDATTICGGWYEQRY